MATTRAKFKCNKILLTATQIRNPEYDALYTEESSAQEVRKFAEEQGIPEWIKFNAPTVYLSPVYAPEDDGHENHKFWSASPSGSLELAIMNPAGAELFEPGEFFYVDFTKAPA